MKKFVIAVILTMSVSASAATNLEDMLAAAESGDSMAWVVVAYTYMLGEYRDGTKVAKDLNKAYAWASLASCQGQPEAKKLVDGIIPKLKDRTAADTLAGEYFKLYGATKADTKP